MNRPHDFSLLSSNSFLHPFLESKFTKKNSLTPKKFHFRRPIFDNHHGKYFGESENDEMKALDIFLNFGLPIEMSCSLETNNNGDKETLNYNFSEKIKSLFGANLIRNYIRLGCEISDSFSACDFRLKSNTEFKPTFHYEIGL